jgi:ATP-binding protein involved in chromosome partitioning
MSMGYLLGKGGRKEGVEGSGKSDEDGPVAWRGLMVMKALQQLLHEVAWGGEGEELDVLVLDMPPGTGDVQLTIGQQVQVDGAVVVSTPQDVALKDAVRGVKMFQTMGIKVLGMVRNMSVFVCPKCGEETRVFAHGGDGKEVGGPQQMMEQMGVDVLGEVPLDPQICYDADRGMPTVVAEEASGKLVNSRFYEEIARNAAEKVGLPWT